MNQKSKRLTFEKKIEIVPAAPFHFDSTIFKPGHFPTNDMKWQPGKRWQTMRFGGEMLGLVLKNNEALGKPKVNLDVFSDKKLSEEFLKRLEKEVVWRFNLDLNLKKFYRDVGKDKLLKPIIRKFRGLRPMHGGSLYEYLIIDIVLQNTTVRRSVYMLQTLFENYGTLLEFSGQKLWCFWEPEILSVAEEQKLRELKMGYRAKSLIKVSTIFANEKVNENNLRTKSPKSQEEFLLSLYGIGPASTGYIMFDVFHRWDFLKHISPWEQKIYTKIFFNKDYEKELVPVEKMLEYFEKWGEWKNLATHYVWENIWWERRNKHLPWLEKLIRL